MKQPKLPRFNLDDLPGFQRLMLRISPIAAIGTFTIGEVYHRADSLEIALIVLTCAVITLLQIRQDARRHPFNARDKR